MFPIPSRSSRARRSVATVLRATGVLVVVGLLPTVAGAEPADRSQTIEGLREKAARVAAELDDLDRRTNTLDENFNNANLELERLRRELGQNQTQVQAARDSLDANRDQAQELAVQAFMGNDEDSSLAGVADDAADASRRRMYLAARFGDSSDVIESLTASQKDLAEEEAALEAANAGIDRKVAEIAASRDDLESTISERRRLYDSVKGELADALAAEQDRLAREAAARAEIEAREAAARASAARRPQAVVVRAGGTSGAAAMTVRAEAAPARQITPPPSDAPIAVQTAMAQQGDPYRWAAAGPDSFDCSGLIMYAYRAAGISLPHSSCALRSMTRSLSVDELQPGDLVFGGSPVHHVGLYIGNGQMVHAPHSGDVVKVSGVYSTSKPVSFGRL